jgi:hypothetical protein
LNRRRFLKYAGATAAVGSAGALYASFSELPLAFTKMLTYGPSQLSEQLPKQTVGQTVEQTVTATTTTPEIVPTAIRPALIEPITDGQYTPVDSLQLTTLGKAKVAEDPSWMPKTEWDDGDEQKMENRILTNVPASFPEVYMRRKFYRDDASIGHFSVIFDAVSDKQALANEFINFTFYEDTQNYDISNPGTPRVYFLPTRYARNSPESLSIGSNISAPVPGNLFPKDKVEFKSTIGPSPLHQSADHKIVEYDFDLDFLTQYSKTIGFYVYFSSSIRNTGSTPYPGYALENIHELHEMISFSDETQPISESLDPTTAAVALGFTGFGMRYLRKVSRRELLHLPSRSSSD